MTFLYKLSAIYSAFLKLLGYERGIGRFIDQLVLDCPKNLRVLDVGCGSGVVGLQFLERFSGATLLATDIEPNFLKETLGNTRNRHIDESRVSVGVSDISQPDKVTYLDGRKETIADKSFDIVTVGGVMGYSKDQRETFRTLLRLIKPGGYLINLEMNSNPAGKFVAQIYKCQPIPVTAMRELIESAGHRVSVVPFTVANFPANLTRLGIVVKVRATEDSLNFGQAQEPAPNPEPPYTAESDFDYST